MLRTACHHVAGSADPCAESPDIVTYSVEIIAALLDFPQHCGLSTPYDLGEIVGFDTHGEVVVAWI